MWIRVARVFFCMKESDVRHAVVSGIGTVPVIVHGQQTEGRHTTTYSPTFEFEQFPHAANPTHTCIHACQVIQEAFATSQTCKPRHVEDVCKERETGTVPLSTKYIFSYRIP